MSDTGFPGADLVEKGLGDLGRKELTLEALLVLIGRPRLLRLGVAVPPPPVTNPEDRLYELLARENPDSAHSRYNALVARLVSFEHAAECAAR